MYKLKFFQSGENLSTSDFDNDNQIVYINLKYILSILDLKKFYTPISNVFVDYYSLVTMRNGEKYYIDKVQLNLILDELKMNYVEQEF